MIKCGKRQKRVSSVTENGEKPSLIWWMLMAVTMESAIFMGKNFQINRHSIVNATDLTLKQMFDISSKLVSEQEEISGLETIGWENHSWKYLSLIGDERVINLQRTKVYVFSNTPIERCMGTKTGMVEIFSKFTETLNDLHWMWQKTVENILWYGECSCLQHWSHLYSWERITQTRGIVW